MSNNTIIKTYKGITLREADDILNKAVAHKIVDIHSDDYQALLSEDTRATVISLPTEGSSYKIAERIVSAIDSLLVIRVKT